MDVGVRVIRGPDWSHGNEDGGHGYVGTVTEISRHDLTCSVQWDYHGNVTKCLAEGEEGQTELKVIDIQQAEIFFNGITCDECGRSGLQGFRWKCVECNDFDLCTVCYMEDKHDKSHVFVRYDNPMATCISCPARCRSRKTKIYGIGPNAIVRQYPGDSTTDEKDGTVIEYADIGKSNHGGVRVDWSGEIKVHKLGASGKSELTMVQSFCLGSVYADHLPLGDLSLPLPSYINEGDRVQVNINVDTLKQLNKEFGGWNEEMEKIVGEIGTVKSLERQRIVVHFDISRRSWQLYRHACQKVSIVKKDDIIKVIDDVSLIHRMQQTHGGWREEIKVLTGKLGKVQDVDSEGTLFVRFPKFGEFLLSPSCCVKQYNAPQLKFEEPEDESAASGPANEEGATAASAEPKCGMVFDIGFRVVRGQNWSWGDQDGGEGHLGTVTEIGHAESSGKVPPLCAQVQWDQGYRNMYRVGYEGQFDLRIYDNAPLGIKHEEKCTESTCPQPEIFGFKWQCEQCPDVALCSQCYHNDKHDIIHKFKRYDYPGHEGTSLPKRQVSSRQKLHGIFDGARVVRGIDWRWGNQDGGEGMEGEVITVVNFSLDTDNDGVEVAWDSGHTNVYRLGYKGCVDIKSVKSSVGGFYYKDHLPTFKLPNQPRPGPEQKRREDGAEAPTPSDDDDENRLKRQDKVKIGVDVEILQAIQKEIKSWDEKIVECVGCTGTVLLVNGQQVTVDFNGKKWTLHEMTLAKVELYTTDQVVRLDGNAEDVKRLQNGHGPWDEDMKKFLGKKGRVVSIDSDGDVTVSFGIRNIKLNPECLKPAQGQPDDIELKREEETKPEKSESEERNLRPPPKMDTQLQSSGMHNERNMNEDQTSRQEQPSEESNFRSQLDSEEEHRFTDESDISDKEKFKESIKGGKHKVVIDMLKTKPTLMQYDFENGRPPLTFACEQKECDASVIKEMIRCGGNVNGSQMDSMPPLLAAVRNGHTKIVNILLKNGADPNITNQNGQTAVHIAVQTKRLEILEILHSSDICDFNKKDKLGDSAVSDAISVGDEAIMDLVFQWPEIDLQFVNKLGFSPIHLAARKGDTHAVKKIIEICPKAVNQAKDDGFTALHLAACMDHSDIVQILIEQGHAKLHVLTDKEGQSPLHIAAIYGSVKSVKYLLEKGGAKVNSPDGNGNNALHLCLMGKPSVMEFAKMQKAETMQKEETLEDDRVEIARVLILHGIQFELRNNEDKLPTDVASSETLKASVERMMKEKTNQSARLRDFPCAVCEEEGVQVAVQIMPCNCKICEDCTPAKPKKCPSCKKPVERVLQL